MATDIPSVDELIKTKLGQCMSICHLLHEEIVLESKLISNDFFNENYKRAVLLLIDIQEEDTTSTALLSAVENYLRKLDAYTKGYDVPDILDCYSELVELL